MITEVRAGLQEPRRRKHGAIAVSLVAVALIWTHGLPGGHQMNGDHGATSHLPGVSTCLAVLGGALVLAAIGLIAAKCRKTSSLRLASPRQPFLSRHWLSGARPRAGPRASYVLRC